jgi:hypothetical protein
MNDHLLARAAGERLTSHACKGAVLIVCVLCLPAAYAADRDRVEHDLDEIARIATAMVDGDICQHIVTPRAIGYMNRTDPRDQWADGDNYDVDDQAFTATKKTLIRLASLASYPVDVNLWMPLEGKPPRIEIVVRNRYEMSQYWEWGRLYQPMFPEMQSVLSTGRRIKVERKAGFVSILAPVRNSLDDVVGLVEVVSALHPDARENVK